MNTAPVKFRFRMWRGMRLPFHSAIDSLMRADWWGSWEAVLEGIKSIAQIPLVLVVLFFILIPSVTFTIAKNNTLIVWRFLKHTAYKHAKGGRNETK